MHNADPTLLVMKMRCVHLPTFLALACVVQFRRQLLPQVSGERQYEKWMRSRDYSLMFADYSSIYFYFHLPVLWHNFSNPYAPLKGKRFPG